MIEKMIMSAKNIKNLWDADNNKNETFLDTEKNTEKYLTGLKKIYDYFNDKQLTAKPEDKYLSNYAAMSVMAGYCYAESLIFIKKEKSLINKFCNSVLENNLTTAPKDNEMKEFGNKLKSFVKPEHKMKM